MRSHLRNVVPMLIGLFLVTLGAPWARAQITNPIRAHLDHSFVIGNTTLPPGDYTFRVEQNSDLGAMTAESADGKTAVDFLVRETTADHTPAHSELTFRKFGNVEFLNRIFETGSKDGAKVTESSRREERLVKEHQQSIEHTEVEK